MNLIFPLLRSHSQRRKVEENWLCCANEHNIHEDGMAERRIREQ